LALIALIGNGCMATINYDINTPSSIVQQMPLAIGVYYPPATRNYHHHFTHGGDVDIHIGDMSVRFWNKVFDQAFHAIVLLEESGLVLPPGNLRLDAIIEVTINDFRRSPCAPVMRP
jgi:hypothetical protein